MKPKIEFKCHRDCTLCPLHEQAKHPGLPTREFVVTGKPVAILIVGEAPGGKEDEEGTSWVGRTGQLLQKFITAARFSEHADIYLANCVRCRPPHNVSPTMGQASKCRQHLQEDLDALLKEYTEVLLLCCGRWGATAVTRLSSLSEGFSMQAQPLTSFKGLVAQPSSSNSSASEATTTQIAHKPPRVFFTYHPAILLPGRKPALVHAVQDHFLLVYRYINGEFSPDDLEIHPEFGAPPPPSLPDPPVVCIDIETYGILGGVNQTVFHPVKSRYIDGVPYDKQIVSVAFGYFQPTVNNDEPAKIRTLVYSWDRHQHHIRRWFQLLSTNKGTVLLGQNIKFDLLYLSHAAPDLDLLIAPHRFYLDDTLLGSFLWYEQRPERGLKELAKLFGLANYDALEVTGRAGHARNGEDPRLHYYNCLDIHTTLQLYRFTWQQIIGRYGPGSAKLSNTCVQMRNAVLWSTYWMEKCGFCFDIKKLKQVHAGFLQARKDCIERAETHGLILSGEGSDASKRTMFYEAITGAGLEHDRRVKYTTKRKDISTNKENVNLLLDALPKDNPYRPPLEAYDEYQEVNGLITRYTGKLLNKPAEGIVCADMSFPGWYVTRSRLNKMSSDEGGTIQARFAATKPPCQTFPPPVKSCLRSRYIGGKLIEYDLSQIELRVAALLSGDETMLNEYAHNIDRHTVTALLDMPNADPNAPDFRGPHGPRQLGKKLNFLMIFRGGAYKFVETALKDLGLMIPLEQAKTAIRNFLGRYPQFDTWQRYLIDTAKTQGYLMLPTGWSRTFGKDRAIKDEINEVVNFPIQTTAAQLLQSAQYKIQGHFFRRKMKARIVMQCHDAIYVDCPSNEEADVDELVDEILPDPPLLADLERILVRTVPITYEKEVLYGD